MKTIVALALALGLTLTAGLKSAWAGGDFHGKGFHGKGLHGRSVFPRTPDPWKHWGRARTFGHHHHGAHHPGFRSHRGSVIVVPGGSVFVPHGKHHGFFKHQPVWVPGQWVWNGFSWLWVPGHWR